MSSSDDTNETSDAARRRRRRSNSLLVVLGGGFLVFGAAAGALYYALRPVTLRIAVGPPGSADHKVIQAMAEAFASESRTVRLSAITTDGAVEAVALLGAGKADLAVGRGDLEMPADAQTVAIVRKNFVVLWSPSGLAGKSSKRKPAPKIKEIADLAGHRVGVIGRTLANAALLPVSVSHLIVARKTLSETTVAAFFRQLFAVRQAIARQVPGAAHITKPDTEKDAELPVHRGAAAVIDGTERTFLDRYGDYFWFALLLLSGIGSAGAWLRHYLNRDEREENTSHRNRILAMVSRVRTAESNQELLAMQREVDAIIGETLECYDDGAIEEEELAAFGLVLELFNHAIVERSAALQAGTLEPARR